jgi:hypothetical protein
MRHRAVAVVLVAGLGVALLGCNAEPAETPDPAAIPSGSLEAQGAEATGPIIELGTGVSEGTGWRFAIYESDDGWCTQVETVIVAETGCGDILPAEGETFGSYAVGEELSNGVTAVQGIVTDEVATVWILLADGRRAPAEPFALADAGLTGKAFLRIIPADLVVTHLQAVAMSGEILDTVELP